MSVKGRGFRLCFSRSPGAGLACWSARCRFAQVSLRAHLVRACQNRQTQQLTAHPWRPPRLTPQRISPPVTQLSLLSPSAATEALPREDGWRPHLFYGPRKIACKGNTATALERNLAVWQLNRQVLLPTRVSWRPLSTCAARWLLGQPGVAAFTRVAARLGMSKKVGPNTGNARGAERHEVPDTIMIFIKPFVLDLLQATTAWEGRAEFAASCTTASRPPRKSSQPPTARPGRPSWQRCVACSALLCHAALDAACLCPGRQGTRKGPRHSTRALRPRPPQAARIHGRHAHVPRVLAAGKDEEGNTVLYQELAVCDAHDLLRAATNNRCVCAAPRQACPAGAPKPVSAHARQVQ